MEELEIINNHRKPEIHTIIIWNGMTDKKFFKKKLNLSIYLKKFKILFNKLFVLNKNKQRELIDSIYIKNKIKINKIVKNSIILLVIKDENPIYKYTSSTSCNQVLNYNMKILKNELRYLFGGTCNNFNSIHSSYNIEEALLVLNPLNLNHLVKRKKFINFKEFFDLLNNDQKLKYVILFDYNIINNCDQKNNIKILVNDYYYFKSITGARSTDKINMRENDNGFNVNNNIIINNNLINFNIRFIGDNYFDSIWEKNMLNSSIKIQFNNFQIKICNDINLYYSVIYHLIVHKNFNYNINMDFIKFSKIEKPYNQKLLIQKFMEFINNHKYKIIKPYDKYVKFYNNFL